MIPFLKQFYRQDKQTRQTQIIGLLIFSLVLNFALDVTSFIFLPFVLIRLGIVYIFFVFFALHLFQVLKAREMHDQAARIIAIVASLFAFQWIGGFGKTSMLFTSGLPSLAVLLIGSYVVNIVINEEVAQQQPQEDRYSLPEFKPLQQNMDMTPKVHTTSVKEVSTSSQSNWYCPSCGDVIPQQSKRCPKCKAKIDF